MCSEGQRQARLGRAIKSPAEEFGLLTGKWPHEVLSIHLVRSAFWRHHFGLCMGGMLEASVVCG